METPITKFIKDNNETNENTNRHWDYCWLNRIPYICIKKSENEFCQIEFNILTVTQQKRFTIINYSDHILPLYSIYSKYSKIPLNKVSATGGSNSSTFTVFAKDAPKIAEMLFDLLELLSKKDQELFDENPIYDKEGYNSEGTHVANFSEGLQILTNEELISLFRVSKQNNPTRLQEQEIMKKELAKRNIANINL